MWWLMAGPVWAQFLNLDQAALRVQKEVEGRVLGGREEFEEGRPIYIIRVLTPDGWVVHVKVDRETGQVFEPQVEKR